MNRKVKNSGAKVSITNTKLKPSVQTMVIHELLTTLMQNTREFALSNKSTKFVKDFHNNQTKLVEDAIWFGETDTSFIVSQQSKKELLEGKLSINDMPYKRVGALLQLNEGKVEDYDDLPSVCEADKKKFEVCIYAAILTINKDHVQLKVAKGTVHNTWFYDAYYFRLPLDFIDRFLNDQDLDIEVRLSYDMQELPSDEYLINHCTRFINAILNQIFKMKFRKQNLYGIVKSDLFFKNNEKYTFKIWQNE